MTPQRYRSHPKSLALAAGLAFALLSCRRPAGPAVSNTATPRQTDDVRAATLATGPTHIPAVAFEGVQAYGGQTHGGPGHDVACAQFVADNHDAVAHVLTAQRVALLIAFGLDGERGGTEIPLTLLGLARSAADGGNGNPCTTPDVAPTVMLAPGARTLLAVRFAPHTIGGSGHESFAFRTRFAVDGAIFQAAAPLVWTVRRPRAPHE